MGIENITLIVEQLNAQSLSVLFFTGGIALSVFYFIRKTATEHVAKIVSVKKAKELLVTQLMESLDLMRALNLQLLNQKDTGDSYEEDTLKEALASVRGIRAKYGIFNYLNSPNLVKEITFYYDGKLRLLEEMLELEEGSLSFQTEYNQKLLQFNRDLENYKNSGINTKEVIEYKREILYELDKIRNQVSASLTNLKSKREEYYTELRNSDALVQKLHGNIMEYKKKELDSKRFYPKYLAFI